MFVNRIPKKHTQPIENRSIKKKEGYKPSYLFVDNRQKTLAQRKIKSSTHQRSSVKFPVIQRLTGMEIELGIPFYEQKNNTKCFPKETNSKINEDDKKNILSFLFGGLQYGLSYGKTVFYDISADHNSFRHKHFNLVWYLVKHSYVNWNEDFQSMTNMEYRTKPFEERNAESSNEIKRAAELIQTHANDAVDKAKSGEMKNLSLPVEHLYTGIPYQSFEKLLKDDKEGMAILNDTKNAMNPTVYYQTTTGVLPSEIPYLFEEAADDIFYKNLNVTLKSRANISREILLESIKMACNVINSAIDKRLVRNLTEGELQSLTGWLTLISQYLIANSIDTTEYRYREDKNGIKPIGGTTKNTVPYLSKVRLKNTILALPKNVRNKLNILDNLLLEKLNLSANRIKKEFNLIDYEGKETVGGKIIEHETIWNIPKLWINGLMNGKNVGHTITGNELQIDDLPKSHHLQWAISDENVIPLEDRKSQSKKSFGESTEIMNIENIILKEWIKAVKRRWISIEKRAQYKKEYAKTKKIYNNTELKQFSHRKLPRFKLEKNPMDVWEAEKKLKEYNYNLNRILFDNLYLSYKTMNDNINMQGYKISPLIKEWKKNDNFLNSLTTNIAEIEGTINTFKDVSILLGRKIACKYYMQKCKILIREIFAEITRDNIRNIDSNKIKELNGIYAELLSSKRPTSKKLNKWETNFLKVSSIYNSLES